MEKRNEETVRVLSVVAATIGTEIVQMQSDSAVRNETAVRGGGGQRKGGGIIDRWEK